MTTRATQSCFFAALVITACTISARAAVPPLCEKELASNSFIEDSQRLLEAQRRLALLGKALEKEYATALDSSDLRTAVIVAAEIARLDGMLVGLAGLEGSSSTMANLATTYLAMVDAHDRAYVLSEFRDIAKDTLSEIQPTLELAADVLAKTKRPGLVAEATKASDAVTLLERKLRSCASR
jgi:hypothetical protein